MTETKFYSKSAELIELENIAFTIKKLRNPNSNPIKIEYRDDTEKGLAKSIITYITLRGGVVDRINYSGRLWIERKYENDVETREIGSLKWIPEKENKTPEISASIFGKTLKIEVRIGREPASEARKKYQKEIERSGGVYFIAKDFATFKKWMDSIYNYE